MSCIHHNFEGKCDLFDGLIESNGCDSIGYCICDDDPFPEHTCEDYESYSDECELCGLTDFCECEEGIE